MNQSLAHVAFYLCRMTPTTHGAVAQTCDGGIEGVQSTSLDVCCVADCGVCGGVGCTPANTSTLTAGDCCTTEISESGVFCDVSGAAPCILTTGKRERERESSDG